MVSRWARGVTAVALASVLAAALPARAGYDDEDAGGTAVVIQDRAFRMIHELTLSTGVLPLDAFVKGVALNARYTLHFDDFHAWEIVGGTYSLQVDSGLTQILRDRFRAAPTTGGQLLGFVDSNYVAKPLYGKFVLFNDVIIKQELLLLGGLTVSSWSDTSYRVGPDVGAALRFHVQDWLSLRFDLRHAVVADGMPYFDPNAQVDGILQLLAGVSFNLGERS